MGFKDEKYIILMQILLLFYRQVFSLAAPSHRSFYTHSTQPDPPKRPHLPCGYKLKNLPVGNQMDHIPQTLDSPHALVQVPFLVTDKFEQIIFNHGDVDAEFDYDDDSGDALLAIADRDGSTQKVQEECDILNFYQARCFFGLLYDFYSLAGKQLEFDIGLYVDHGDEIAVVTTKELLKELHTVALKEKSLSDDAKVEKYIRMESFLQPVQNLTAQLHAYVLERSDSIRSSDEMLDDTSQQEFWILQVIAESTAMLSETILTAARQIYLPSSSASPSVLEPIWGRDLPPAPRTPWLMERFSKAGWCPRQVVETSETALGSRSVLFSLSSIDKKGDLHGNHDQCSVESCVLEDIDNDTYQPLHAPDCDHENCPLVPEIIKPGRNDASKIIARMVGKSQIPVISVVEQPDSTPLLSIKAHQPGHTRVGPTLRKRKRSTPEVDTMEMTVNLCNLDPKEKPTNERKRAPPPLDIKRGVQSLGDLARIISADDVDDTCLQYVAISHVWAHGLGNRDLNAVRLCQLRRLQRFVNLLVPEYLQPMPFWIDTICVPLDPTARTAAIKEMRTVYRDALAVLVIDHTLMEVDFAKIETQEFGGSGLANWQLELLMRIKASPWAQRLWTYHESWLAKDLYFQVSEEDVPAIQSQDIITPRPQRTFNPFNQREQEKETERQFELIKQPEAEKKEDIFLLSESATAMLPLEYTAAYLLQEATALQLFGRALPEDEFHKDLRYLSQQLSLRTTSRLQDEAICLSALLGLEAAAVITDAQGKAVSEEDRMRRLWEVLGQDDIPVEILFCNRPIYGDRGCGWMPRSLLRDNKGNFINHMRCRQALAKQAEHGILVEMGGIGFEIPDNAGPLVTPWDVILRIAQYKYRLAEVEASAAMPDWRSSVISGKFAVLMPQNELRALLENVEERVGGSRSHSSDLPFGLLVNVLEIPKLQDEYAEEGDDGSVSAVYVLRREMVEFEIVLDDDADSESEIHAEGESSDAESDEADEDLVGPNLEDAPVVFVEAQAYHAETRKWWVG